MGGGWSARKTFFPLLVGFTRSITFGYFMLSFTFCTFQESSSSSTAIMIDLCLCLEDGIENGYRTADAFVRGAALDELVQGDFSVAVAVHFLGDG